MSSPHDGASGHQGHHPSPSSHDGGYSPAPGWGSPETPSQLSGPSGQFGVGGPGPNDPFLGQHHPGAFPPGAPPPAAAYGGYPPGAGPYGPAPYAPSPYGDPYGRYPAPMPYAHWGQRVLASLLDSLCCFPLVLLPGMAMAYMMKDVKTVTDAYGQETTTGSPNAAGAVLLGLSLLALIGFNIWNTIWRQGRKGQSLGKQVVGIMLLDERTGAPVGTGMSFARQLAHFLDGAMCDLGYLWPLWDEKNQTFADKVMNTVVVKMPPR